MLAEIPCDVLSRVTNTEWDVLSGVANLYGMLCSGCQKMAWDVLSLDVLCFVTWQVRIHICFGLHSFFHKRMNTVNDMHLRQQRTIHLAAF